MKGLARLWKREPKQLWKAGDVEESISLFKLLKSACTLDLRPIMEEKRDDKKERVGGEGR